MSLGKLTGWMLLLVLGPALAGCGKSTPAPPPRKPHSATLVWDASTSKVTGYRIYRSTDPNAKPDLLAVTSADVTRYEDRTVEAGRTYYYAVRAVGLGDAESEFSEKISATIPPD